MRKLFEEEKRKEEEKKEKEEERKKKKVYRDILKETKERTRED